MASEAQIAANRLNAQKSTGPRSVEGKAASRMNALTTGVHAQSTIIRGEDPAALDTLTAEYYATHAPITAEERFYLDSMIRFDWQLRRLTRIEAELYESRAQDVSRLSPTCPMGQVYFYNSATFPRLTRQMVLIQRCFRDASREFKTLRDTRMDPAETNPIPASAEEPARPPVPPAPEPPPASPDPVDPFTAPAGRNPLEPLLPTRSDPNDAGETNPIGPPTPPTRYPHYDANGRILAWEYVPRSKSLDGDNA